MTHFLAMVLFSFFVSIAFATFSSDHQTREEKIRYGLKVFAYFVGVGLIIAWILFPLPF